MAETRPGNSESGHDESGGTRRPWLWIIIAAYLLLAGTAAWLMPLTPADSRWPEETRQKFIPPDEQAHVGYIEYLITHHRLPVFSDPDANYEAHQPPVFYLSSVPAYLIGKIVGRWIVPNEPVGMAVFAVRVWCVLIGAAVIWAVFLLGQRLFPDNRRLALATAGFAALLPMHWVNLAGVTNDGLAELAATVCLIVACDLARAPDPRRAAVLGGLIGVGLLIKSNVLIVVPVAILAVTLAVIRGDSGERWRSALKLLAIALGVMVLICGWWWIRNQLLYGDPPAQQTFVELFSKDRATPEWFFQRGIGPSAYLMLITVTTLFSYWGVFGQAIIAMPTWYYAIGFALWIPMIIGLLKAWWRVRNDEAPISRAWILAAVAAVMAGFVLLRFNMSFFQAQARYLFIAIGPLAAIFIGGWWEFLWGSKQMRRRMWRIASHALFIALCIMAVTALWNLQPGSPVRLLPIAGM